MQRRRLSTALLKRLRFSSSSSLQKIRGGAVLSIKRAVTCQTCTTRQNPCFDIIVIQDQEIYTSVIIAAVDIEVASDGLGATEDGMR